MNINETDQLGYRNNRANKTSSVCSLLEGLSPSTKLTVTPKLSATKERKPLNEKEGCKPCESPADPQQYPEQLVPPPSPFCETHKESVYKSKSFTPHNQVSNTICTKQEKKKFISIQF
jgi:hypothetical protein